MIDLTDKQKELLRRFVEYKNKPGAFYPFTFNTNVNGRYVIVGGTEALEFDHDDYMGLVDDGLMQITPRGTYRVTSLGDRAVKNDFDFSKLLPSPPQQSVGMINYGNISGGNFQSIGLTSAEVTQIINDPASLEAKIDELIDSLIDQVKPELTSKQLIDYIKTAEELKQSISLDSPPPSHIIQKFVRTLSFLDSTDGAINLAIKVWPILYVILQLINGVISGIPIN